MSGIRLNHIEMLYLLWALPSFSGFFYTVPADVRNS